MPQAKTATLGVVIVTYRSIDVVLECLESVLASRDVELKVVVVDNDSPDDTRQAIIGWAAGDRPFERPERSPLAGRPTLPKPIDLAVIDDTELGRPLGRLTLVRAAANRGFAGGVNVGLQALRGQVDWYWVLNPDCVVPDDTAARLVEAADKAGDFALMTCNTAYYDWPDRVQTTGGYVNRLTGVCSQRGYNGKVGETDVSDGASLDWVTGANMVASPQFLEQVGLMTEDYFLYYEEVDWAFRRGERPLVFLPDAVVYHHGGTVIGSGSMDRRPTPFSNYFNHRNRIRFARRFLSRFPLGAYLYGLAKAGQLVLLGAPDEAYAVVAGMFDWAPPRPVRERFSDPEVRELAFSRTRI